MGQSGARAWQMAILGGAMLFAADAAQAERRLALVIGNDRYEHLPVLEKAVADAQAYERLFKAKGFDEVILATDVDRSALEQTLGRFVDRIQPGDTVVFVYSGHGWSSGGQNYLIATDAPPDGSESTLRRLSIPIQNGANGIIDEMERLGAGLKVAIIDACRDNPFTPAPGVTRSIGQSRGLARLAPVSRGTFVVFSAGAGQAALDRLSNEDSDPNSVFARTMLPRLANNLWLEDAANDVQIDVLQLAASISHEQQPAYYDEVPGKACLWESCVAKPGQGAASAEVAPPADPAARAYEAALAQNTIESWDAFLRYFPDGYWADLGAAARDALSREIPEESSPLQAALPPAHRDRPRSAGERCVSAAMAGGGTVYCASSVLDPQSGNRYGPASALDLDPSTAWVEGTEGDGIGEWLSVSFEEEREVNAIELVNGYPKNADIFAKNGRVQSAELVFSDGSIHRVELADTGERQRITLASPVRAKWVQFKVSSVYRGSKYRDTALAEFRVIFQRGG